MNEQNFRRMTPDEFKAFSPSSHEEAVAYEKEAEFREWCEEREEDPMIPESRESYDEEQEELGDKFWDNLDENDRAGWEDNMNKD